MSACLNRNDMLTSAVSIYFGTDEETGSSACKAAGPSPSPRVEIARRVKKKSRQQRQSRRPVHRAPVPDEAPFPGILRPQPRPGLIPCSETHTHTGVFSFGYENPQTRTRLSRPQMLPPPLDEGHHAHCFRCTMCMKGSPT